MNKDKNEMPKVELGDMVYIPKTPYGSQPAIVCHIYEDKGILNNSIQVVHFNAKNKADHDIICWRDGAWQFSPHGTGGSAEHSKPFQEYVAKLYELFPPKNTAKQTTGQHRRKAGTLPDRHPLSRRR